MKNLNKLKIIRDRKEFNGSLPVLIGNDKPTKLDLLLFDLYHQFSTTEGTIDITTWNVEPSIRINVADEEVKAKIKRVVEQHLGFVFYVQH